MARRAGLSFANALRQEIAASDGNKLRKIAKRLINMAEDGEMQAIREIADRLDGKPTQVVDQTVTMRRENMSDDELLDIASRGRDGTSEEKVDPAQSNGVGTLQ